MQRLPISSRTTPALRPARPVRARPSSSRIRTALTCSHQRLTTPPPTSPASRHFLPGSFEPSSGLTWPCCINVWPTRAPSSQSSPTASRIVPVLARPAVCPHPISPGHRHAEPRHVRPLPPSVLTWPHRAPPPQPRPASGLCVSTHRTLNQRLAPSRRASTTFLEPKEGAPCG